MQDYPMIGFRLQREALLRCKLSPGQFSDECVVCGRDFCGQGFSLFAPLARVLFGGELSENQSTDGYLLVYVQARKADALLVLLPRESLEMGQTVTVAAEDVIYETAEKLELTAIAGA